MRFRASIFCLLILSQPLSVFGAVWQSDNVDDSRVSHCDSEMMAEQHQSASGETNDNDHSDCNDSCDSCTACTAIVNAQIVIDQPHVRPADSTELILVMPSGQFRLLFRPPILS